jgi:hypothetical protein
MQITPFHIINLQHLSFSDKRFRPDKVVERSDDRLIGFGTKEARRVWT